MTPGLPPRLLPAMLLGTTILILGHAKATDTDPATDEVVRLPAYNISSDRLLPAPEPWRYARIPGFEVLSSSSDRETRRLLRDFDVFRQALSIAWPVPERPTSGSVLVICGSNGRFSQFVPPAGSPDDMGTASLFRRDREQTAIVVHLASTIRVFDPDRVNDSGGAIPEFEVNAHRQLYREYVKFLLSQGQARPPAWLAEGIAQIVMNMEFTDRWVTFGKIDRIDGTIMRPSPGLAGAAATTDDETEAGDVVAPGATVPDATFNVSLSRRALMPLAEMFAVTRDSPEARNPLGNNRWVQQCYAFVHMCLYGERKRWQQPLADFLQRTGSGPASEAVFEECFGMNYKRMAIHLRGYINFTDYQYQRFLLKGDSRFAAAPPEVRDASEGEIGRIRGDALRLAGRNRDAQIAYQDAYRRGARDPGLLAALALDEAAAGNNGRARQLLEAAAAAGDFERPSAWYELARLRFLEACANPGGMNGRLSAKQAGDVITALARAQNHPPSIPEVFGLAAAVWKVSEVPPTRDQLRALDAGVVQFPRYSEMLLDIARLNLDAGDAEHAGAVALVGAEHSGDSDSKARFEELVALTTQRDSTQAVPAAAPN